MIMYHMITYRITIRKGKVQMYFVLIVACIQNTLLILHTYILFSRFDFIMFSSTPSRRISTCHAHSLLVNNSKCKQNINCPQLPQTINKLKARLVTKPTLTSLFSAIITIFCTLIKIPKLQRRNVVRVVGTRLYILMYALNF